jgi:3-dehydroquinate dehydratase-2
MSRILVINGPNLDHLGRRQPEIYGSTTARQLIDDLTKFARSLGAEVEFFQASDEGNLVERIGSIGPEITGVVINPGAFTHYSWALGDAIAMLSQPVVEVHISNILEREPFRRRTAMPASYRIYGRGLEGYFWAIRYILNLDAWPVETFSYGRFRDQFGELRRPRTESGHLGVLIHGGLWYHQWTLDTTAEVAIDLAKRGSASVNLEYRRPGLGGGWPETFDDVVAALETLPDITGVAAADIALIGHSAGATMALWAAAFHPGPVVALAPYPDLGAPPSHRLWADAVHRLLGSDQPTPAEISPLHRPAPQGDVLVVAAREDSVSPLPVISEYVERFPGVDFKTCEGDHMVFLEPSSSAWGSVTDWLETRKATL